jgi:hypothetical protein
MFTLIIQQMEEQNIVVCLKGIEKLCGLKINETWEYIGMNITAPYDYLLQYRPVS